MFLLFLALCVLRLFYTQFFRSNYLAGLAKKQHNFFVELEPVRGTIYDAHLKPQALNIPVDSVYASPNSIAEGKKDDIAQQLARVLKLNPALVRERLGRKKAFVWIARKVPPEQADALRELKLKGVGFIKESKRSYPNNYLASHIIGFAGLDNAGLEGLEASCDEFLRGEAGWAVFLRDARQKKLDLWDKMVMPKDGYDVVLTIDEVIQYIAERELDKAFTTYHARGASIVVMDPYTGRILALANRPTYDPNDRSGVAADQIRNRAICDMIEPGSVFKIVTAAAVLQEGVASEEDRYFCENGAFKVFSHTLHDHQSHGWLTFRQVIEESSNIGTTKAAMKLGPEAMYRYARAFGFGSRNGIDLPGEIGGVLKEPGQWSKISIAAIPIGQEVGATVMQLASAVSVIANGGVLMKPFVIEEVRDKSGQTIKKFRPQIIRTVISVETAMRVKQILAGVVTEGTGKLAAIKDIPAAGKTGTAQKIESNGTYSHSKYYASFIGFAPADNPAVAIAVVVDEPRPYYFGGVVAAPVFREVARDVLKYLAVSQPRKESGVLNENPGAS